MKITGIILAGGNSSRMGENKALINFNGKRIIDHVYGTISSFCEEIIISTNSHDFDFLQARIVADEIKNIGPIAGIYSALKKSSNKLNIIVSCDMPYISADLLKYLITSSENYEIAIPKHDGINEPITGKFLKHTYKFFENAINDGIHSPPKVICNSKLKEVSITPDLDFYSEKLFVNINDKKDLSKALKKI
ncbi:MAG: molybdenum cofactor guanylyltransferase [Bacteroidetes bacterium]|jgi:molybdenum cofactor guanylyltransferase|nr:molybdenum cofactor guanylyltransferase [Bacteroidota bacterium]MBT6685384.1 molybdenum cofactor guanylyltransferase [Bacteroidota bacterium]MBT7145036.1 molybdenum cofactor guanylyltransferase [Bacteroidota bacterium]MBT7492721.1 molybdenum cofactor guanylyltransferase [Bacteroidota bacterium]